MKIDEHISKSLGVDQIMPTIQRPPRISAEIANLIANGTVADLFTEKGQLLQEMMTADELDTCHNSLPMPETPNFDGQLCDFCTGRTRFKMCQDCHGEALPTAPCRRTPAALDPEKA